MAKSKIAVVMTGEELDLWRKTQKLILQQAKMQDGYRKTSRESKKASREQGLAARKAAREFKASQDQQSRWATSAVRGIGAIAAALGVQTGVSGVLAMINKQHERWKQNIAEISTLTSAASKEMIAFATLQQGGTKAQRVMQSAALGARHGVPSGEAWNVVQALQSAPGRTYATGMKAAESVFAGSQVGIPVGKGLELEILGASQKQKPGEFIRMAYAAGQASSRDPMTLAGAASALKFFDDKTFGFAAGAVLSGSISKEKLPVYLRQAGMALSRTGSLQEFFEEQGMGKEGMKAVAKIKKKSEAGLDLFPEEQEMMRKYKKAGSISQFQRLRTLNRLGIDTAVELQEAGVGELRQLEALAGLVPNVEAIEKTYKDIQRRAKPGLLVSQRAKTEVDIPMLKTARNLEARRQREKNRLALGPEGAINLRKLSEREQEGAALSRLGIRYGYPMFGAEYYTMEGGVPVSDMMWHERALMSAPNKLRFKHEMSRLREAERKDEPIPPYPYPYFRERGGAVSADVQAKRYHELYPEISVKELMDVFRDHKQGQDRQTEILEEMLRQAEQRRQNPTLKGPDDDR